jgi:hypothetical protein
MMATKAIWESEGCQQVPIVALTAYDTYHEKAIEAGCNEDRSIFKGRAHAQSIS